MALCEICLENKAPGHGSRVRFDACPECGGEVQCSGYTTPSYKGETAHCPICDECGEAPVLTCCDCAWHNSVYDDVISGLGNW
jgi:hypothetical protein